MSQKHANIIIYSICYCIQAGCIHLPTVGLAALFMVVSSSVGGMFIFQFPPTNGVRDDIVACFRLGLGIRVGSFLRETVHMSYKTLRWIENN